MGHRCRDCYTFTPHAHPERLERSLPRTTGKEFIFTCANGDISFQRPEFVRQILKVISSKPEKTFLIQTKNPAALAQYKFPANVIIGITLETNRDVGYCEISKAPVPTVRHNAFKDLQNPRKMITVEPIMEFDHEELKKMIVSINPEMVWVGFDTKKSRLPEPTVEEAERLISELQAENILVIPKYIPVKGSGSP